MDKVLSVLKSTKILGIVGSILLIIGTLFPFYTVSFLGIKASVKLIESTTGKIMLIVGIISLAMIFIDFIIIKIPEGKAKVNSNSSSNCLNIAYCICKPRYIRIREISIWILFTSYWNYSFSSISIHVERRIKKKSHGSFFITQFHISF